MRDGKEKKEINLNKLDYSFPLSKVEVKFTVSFTSRATRLEIVSIWMTIFFEIGVKLNL